MAEELSNWDIWTEVEAVPWSDLEAQVLERRQAGMPVIALSR
jgi:hypothetical protein